MGRKIAYNIVLAHIPEKATVLAAFSSRNQTNPIESLELEAVDSIPIDQIEFDMKAETPDASIVTIESIEENSKKTNVPKELLEKIQPNEST